MKYANEAATTTTREREANARPCTILPPAPVPPLGDELPFAWASWSDEPQSEVEDFADNSQWPTDITALLEDRGGAVSGVYDTIRAPGEHDEAQVA